MPQRSLATIADAAWAVLPALALAVVLAAEPPSSEPPTAAPQAEQQTGQ